MTQEEIQKLLLEDLASRIRSLNNRLKAEVTQNMFDALLSMMFNTGEGNSFFKKAVSLTNQKKYQEAANMISSGPVTSKGKVFAGLVRRRKNESDTYIA
jgi:GH24 family phage-related lysozyme (muramidase)